MFSLIQIVPLNNFTFEFFFCCFLSINSMIFLNKYSETIHEFLMIFYT